MSNPAEFNNKGKMIKEESTDSTYSNGKAEKQGVYGIVDELHAIMKANIEEHCNWILDARRSMVGTVVNKIFDNGRYMGNVVDYDPNKKCLKVAYENGILEDVYEDELHHIIAPPYMVNPYADDLKARNMTVKGEPTSEEANCSGPEDGPKPKKAKLTTKNTTDYVPLAYKEKKKDVYIWYW